MSDLFKDTLLIGWRREEKCLPPGGIQTHDLCVTRCVLDHFATTTAHIAHPKLICPGLKQGLNYNVVLSILPYMYTDIK